MRALPLLVLCACASAQAPGAPADPEPAWIPEPATVAPAPASACGMDVRRLLADELARRPLSGEDDLYKLVRQAVLGPPVEVDPARGRAALARELERAGDAVDGEPIVEDLDETTGTVRLNLRKWRFVRGTLDELWPVVHGSARAMQRDPARLPLCLDAAAASLASLGRDEASFRARVSELSEQGYPDVPQTPAYLEVYQPAYRVVLRRLLPPWVTAPPPDAG